MTRQNARRHGIRRAVRPFGVHVWLVAASHRTLAASLGHHVSQIAASFPLGLQGEVDATALASKLKISEASAIRLVAHLVSKSKVKLHVSATGKGDP